MALASARKPSSSPSSRAAAAAGSSSGSTRPAGTSQRLPSRTGSSAAERAGRAHRGAKVHVPDAVRHEVRDDDRGVERAAVGDVVLERVALGPVRVAHDEIEARHVQEAAARQGPGAPVASDPDAYRGERGQSWHGRSGTGRRGNAQFSSAAPMAEPSRQERNAGAAADVNVFGRRIEGSRFARLVVTRGTRFRAGAIERDETFLERRTSTDSNDQR